MSLGGKGKQMFNYEQIAHALAEGKSTEQVAEQFECSLDTVRAAAKFHDIKLRNIGSEMFKERSRKIVALNGNVAHRCFESVASAAIWCFKAGLCKTLNSGVRSHIADCANGVRKSAYGFRWQYV